MSARKDRQGNARSTAIHKDRKAALKKNPDINLKDEVEALKTEYTPKGSMCAACRHKNRDCSYLPFGKMQVMLVRNDNTKVVICSHFVNEA